MTVEQIILEEIKKSDEQVMKVVHRHWFDIASNYIAVFVFLAFTFGILSFFFFGSGIDSEVINGTLFAFILETIILIAWIYVFFIWILYYFDVWIITDRRIINTEQKSFFFRSTSELKMERIQDVTVEISGLIPTMLNYGDVFIQTAGETERFRFRNIPNPSSVKDLIMSLQKKRSHERMNELGDAISEEIIEGRG